MPGRPKIGALLIEQARVLRGLPLTEQVAALIEMARRESDLAKALALARFLNNPYAARLFYNELVTIHYQELVQQGKLVPL